MPSVFDTTTAVTANGDGSYSADIDKGWVVGAGVNGGYLLAVMANALRAALPAKPDPLSVSAYYLSAATPGPAEVVVQVKREGGTVATASADLVQDGVIRISALATCGDLDRFTAEVQTTATPFDLPPLEECSPIDRPPAAVWLDSPLRDRFDMRFHPDHLGWARGEPDGRGEFAAWFRLEDDREPDPTSLLLVVDALPPVTFSLGRPGWAPTLELTAHVRAKPAPGWLRVRHASRNVAGGLFEEDCEVWDSSDRLVAQARQLAMLPR